MFIITSIYTLLKRFQNCVKSGFTGVGSASVDREGHLLRGENEQCTRRLREGVGGRAVQILHKGTYFPLCCFHCRLHISFAGLKEESHTQDGLRSEAIDFKVKMKWKFKQTNKPFSTGSHVDQASLQFSM